MKKIIFTKKLSVVGASVKVSGEIVATMNYAKENVETMVKLASGMQMVKEERFVHKLDGFINDVIFSTDNHITSEAMLFREIDKLEAQILEETHKIANAEPKRSFAEKMADLGFSN